MRSLDLKGSPRGTQQGECSVSDSGASPVNRDSVIDDRLAELVEHPDVVSYIESGTPYRSHADLTGGSLYRGCTVAVCTYKRADGLERFLESLKAQEPTPAAVVVVDASPDGETERLVRGYQEIDQLCDWFRYFRVRGKFDTLTCSRNLAVNATTTDLLVFFDDDVVLEPNCVAEMEKVHRQRGEEVVGVGAYDTNDTQSPPFFWRMRRILRMVPHLKPGHYARSGISIPWSFLQPTDQIVEGEWLVGFAMMWKTAKAQETGFNEAFGGHSTGEDLDFSLRMARHGKLCVAGKARILHLQKASGRPNAYMSAYTAVRNAYDIHRRCLAGRTWRDVFRFFYAYVLDWLMRATNLLSPGDRSLRWNFLRGRLRFFREVLLRKNPPAVHAAENKQ